MQYIVLKYINMNYYDILVARSCMHAVVMYNNIVLVHLVAALGAVTFGARMENR